MKTRKKPLLWSAPKPRDMQKGRVYKAEEVLRRFAKPLREIVEVERYVARVLSRQSILRRYPNLNPDVQVKDGRGTRRAMAHGARAISLPLWARNDWVTLHELAHTIVSRHYLRVDAAPHGWQYCAIYLDLVMSMMGKEAHDALKASFKAHKVRYTEPRAKRVLTEEQREVLRARLAAGRAK
jgi:putative metallohydrolase (TIGR04338 family)